MNDNANDSSKPDPFDLATAVKVAGDRRSGHTSDGYWAFVGPFGGATAATVLRSVLEHPQRVGDPVSLTINFCAPIERGPFDLAVREVRTNRSSQHWYVELSQSSGVAATATAVFALRRPTWSHLVAHMPHSPPPEAVAVFPQGRSLPWVDQYEFRFVDGAPDLRETPLAEPATARTLAWIRDRVPRQIDGVSLCSMADAFFGRIFHVRGTLAPFGTISMTVYFHADSADLQSDRITTVLGLADARVFHKSYADQTAELWSPSGALLASTHQVAYYKVEP